jgi:voltage-gated potassium channel
MPVRRFIRRFALVAGYCVLLVAAGTVAFGLLSGWTLADALWMTVITVTAVGYEEVRALDGIGRAIATFLLVGGITGMGLWFALITSAIVEMDLANVFRTRRTMKRISEIRDHVIVCGAGRTGLQVARELTDAGWPWLVVERDPDRAEELNRDSPGSLVLVGDATKDDTLVEARIGQARGLVACLSQDTDNLFVCLTARDLQPNLVIVARAYDEQTMQKLHVAGADHVVSPNVTGGIRMASMLLRPSVVSFLDVLTRGEGLALRLEEVRIPRDSSLAGLTLAEAKIPLKTGLIIIAMRHLDVEGREQPWSYNPGPGEEIRPGDLLIVMGAPGQVDSLRKAAAA